MCRWEGELRLILGALTLWGVGCWVCGSQPHAALTLGVFGVLQVGSGALQHLGKVRGFPSARSNHVQGEKSLGAAAFVALLKGCPNPELRL